MATQQQIKDINGLYVAYFDRAADPEGLQFWIDQLDNGRDFTTISQDFATSVEAKSIYSFLAAPDDVVSASPAAFITSIYMNLFGRAPEADGLAFWTEVLANGSVTPGDMVEAIMLGAQDTVVDGEVINDKTTIENKIACAQEWTERAAEMPGFVFDDKAYAGARDAIEGVTADPASVAAAKAVQDSFFRDINPRLSYSEVHTVHLAEVVVEPGTADIPVTEKMVYWGYNPHGHDETSEGQPNEGPVDGGVPLPALLEYFQALAGTNLFELDTIDTDAGESLDLSSVVTIGLSPSEAGGGTLTLVYDDYEADIALGQEYFDLLNSLIFDAEGNSRLFEKEVAVGVPVYLDEDGNVTTVQPDGTGGTSTTPIGYVDAVLDGDAPVTAYTPLVLTPNENNGGTMEGAFTTAANDLIQVGQLEYLHGAYIDGGAGMNMLEIDAKGLFAQPKAVLNIQHISIENLPNIYTGGTESAPVNFYPGLVDDSLSQTSIIDLSRAVDVQTITVTEGDFAGIYTGETNPGYLTVTGIRDAALVTLDGYFGSQVRLNYRDTSSVDGVTVVFNNLNMDSSSGSLQVAHNSPKLTIESAGASNYVANGDLGGSNANLRELVILGDAYLQIDGDLDASFTDSSPVSIDASANTAGVDLYLTNSEQVTFLGSQGDDRFTVETDEAIQGSVNIGGRDQSVTITDMDGDNYFRVDSNEINITVGDGDNTLELGGEIQGVSGDMSTATVVAGNGSNDIAASMLDIVSITAGDGGNKISVNANEINIETGSGNDTVIVSGAGSTSDLVDSDATNPDTISDAALLNINVGGGTNTVVLGGDVEGVNYASGITATAGSSISGENIKLYVEEASDLRAAELTGITSVVLDLVTSAQITGSDAVGTATVVPVLTLTDVQFAAIGAGNFSVDQAAFNTYGQLKIIVTQSTTLTDLGVDSLPAGIDLVLELQDGVVLEMTAEQLHMKVAPQGVTLANDGNTDELSGSVLITDAGLDFDPFNNSDQVRTDIGGSIYYGGSLSSADFSTDIGSNGVQQSEWGSNVLLDASPSGYDRPADAPSYSRITIDTADGDITPFDTFHTFLRIIGDDDVTFTPVEAGIDDWGRPIMNAGTAIELGVDTATTPDTYNDFIVDFSSVGGVVENLTLANFQNAAAIYGNGTSAAPARLNVELSGNLGDANQGLVSQGVQTYVVTDIETLFIDSNGDLVAAGTTGATAAPTEFWTCETTQDLVTLGLRGNFGEDIIFGNTELNVDLLMEVAYEKANGYVVGDMTVEFARPGADAVVNVVGLEALPVGEQQIVEGITLNNAETAVINVTGGDTVIQKLAGTDVETFTFTADADLSVESSFITSATTSVDGSAVVGDFIITVAGTIDLSEVDLIGIDQMVLLDNADVTLSAEQLVDLAGKIVDDGSTTQVNVVDLSTEALDLSAIDTDNIGTVTFLDVDGTIVVDAATNFGDADSVTILAESSDTAVEMTAEQFGTITGGTVNVTEDNANNATLSLSALADDAELILDNVDADADVILQVEDLTATSDMEITEDGEVDSIALEVSGTVDLTAAELNGNIDTVSLAAGSTLTLTAAQVLAIGDADADGDGIADAWEGAAGSTLNITDLSTQDLDLDLLAAAGINIGTVSILNTNGPITIDPDTTFGGADEIITPTADAGAPEYGTEQTNVTMTVAQFASSAGLITGDAQINLTELYNNVDTDSDFIPDAADFDLSGIANAGTISFKQDTIDYADPSGSNPTDHVVTLTDTADLGGFEVLLNSRDLIRLATEAQASIEITSVSGVTGVQWLWTTFGAEVDTSGYDMNITTLFIDEALLISQPIEEDLWSTLAGSIVVEKINGSVIPELIKYDRINTFEAFTNLVGGINYDDDAEFSTIVNLTMNLEGEVNIEGVLLGDTQNGNGSTPNIDGRGYFKTLTINSYVDLTNNPELSAQDPSTSGRVIAVNTLGDIGLNPGSVDELVNITINTYGDGTDGSGTSDDQYSDPVNVNGAQAPRDGLAIETGVITFAANEAKDASLTLDGDNDITLGGVDISDAEVSLLSIDANNHSGELEIGGIDLAGGLNDFGEIYVIDGHTAEAGDTLGDSTDANGNTPGAPGTQDLLVVVDGDNDLTAATLDIEAVHITGDSTLTLTAQQIIAIGEGNFSIAPGVNVTLNVTELGNAPIDLNAIQDAGFNIGTVSTVEDTGSAVNTVLDDSTTLGGADELQVLLNDDNNSLTLTATQYLQLNGGNITEVDSDGTTVNSAAVTITDLVTASNRVAIPNPNDDARWSVNLDLTTVATTGTHTLEVGDKDVTADVTIDLTSDLSDFIVQLDDVNSDLAIDDQLAGQTVRFTNEIQAGRQIDVVNADDNVTQDPTPPTASQKDEKDTNVVWDFDTVTGPINTSLYDAMLGRLWVSDELVKSDNDLEDLFSASDLNGNTLQDDINLNGNIIVRIVNTQNLDLIDVISSGFSRTLEVEAFTNLSATGLVFDEQDLLVDVDNLTIDLGGDVQLGDLEIGNVLQVPNTDQDSDQFGVLTINSVLASTAGHYLLPEDFVSGTNTFPSGPNIVGNISAGTNRNELTDVVINTLTGILGTDIEIGEIFFAEDTLMTVPATFTANGNQTVTVKSLDTSDPEVVALTINNNLTGGPGALNITGGSPGFDGGNATGNTETLTVVVAAGTVTTFGSTVGGTTFAGVYGEELSLIDLSGPADADINLGVIAGVDSDNFTLTTSAAPGDGDVFAGDLTLTLGEADANGAKAPELSATGIWVLDFSSAASAALTITDDVTFNAGGNLTIDSAAITIEGAVDLSVLDLTLTNVTFEVPAGSSLTLTAEQADALTITGGGDVVITELDKATFEDATGLNGNIDLGGIMTATGDTGTVSLDIDSTGDIDLGTSNLGVADVAITGTGTVDASLVAIVPVDRNDPATAATVADDTLSTFTVAAGATLALAATQVGEASGVATADYALQVSGGGTTAVGDLSVNPDADLSGLTTAAVEAAVVSDTTFTGDLGTAVVTVSDAATLTTSFDIATGNTFNEVAAPAGTGALVVTLDATNDAADFTTIPGDLGDVTAAVQATMTFTGNLDGADILVDAAVAQVDLTISADQVDGVIVEGAGSANDENLIITDLASNLAVDLSGVDTLGANPLDSATADFTADGTFTGDLGTVTVTIADNVTMTASASVLVGADVNKEIDAVGPDNGAVAVTLSNADANDEVTDASADADAINNLVDYDLTNLLTGALIAAADITSITVLDDLTFIGTLVSGVLVADGATLSLEASVIDGLVVNAAGTTGAVNVDATSFGVALSIGGSANYTVTGLGNNLGAEPVTGSLDVTTVDASLTITVGAGVNTIDADAAAAGKIITLLRNDGLPLVDPATSVSIDAENADVDASGLADADTDTSTNGVTINGGAGDQTLTGGANDDTIDGGAGSDILVGNAGNDVLIGGIGNDTLTGGAGADTYIVEADTDTITLLENGDALQVSGAADAVATISGTFIASSATSNTSSGTVTLAITNDGLGVDMSLAGGNAGYTMNGSGTADILIGSNFADIITGGAGIDELSGGGDADTFVFASGDTGITVATADVINDFLTAVDNIDVGTVDPGLGDNYSELDGTGRDEATFISAANAAFIVLKTDTYVEYNADSSGDAWAVTDRNSNGVLDADDTFVVLVGVGAAGGVDGADFGY